MKINNESTLQNIRTEFHNKFPYLKIEFYRHDHDAKHSSPKADQITGNEKISDLVGHSVNVDFEIHPLMTVAEFEKIFYEKTGIGVQVFRNSAGIWLQTSSTDVWTLEKQNGKGERSESHQAVDPIDITDFDIE
jgi:hypothetical protein